MNRARLISGLWWGLLLAQFALVWARVCLPHPLLGDAGWPEGLLLLLAAGGTLAGQARQAPSQNVALASIIILSLAGLALAVGARAGIPLGPITGPGRSGNQLLGWLPWAAALWLLALLTSRGVARLILRPCRASSTCGFQVIGLTVLLVVLFNLAFQPFASCVEHSWPWEGGSPPADWRGTPCVGLGAQAVTALVILIFATPSLINKKRASLPPDSYPLITWVLANLLFTTAAITRHLWLAAALASLSAVVVTLLGVRGANRNAVV
ncbi:MAG: hypothetical protein ABSH34_28710 [Verrucomicrobiota bacterium]|jgi:hypothetical protein